MTRKRSTDDILQLIRDMVEDGHTDMLLQWITNETFVVLTSPDSTPELRDEAWRRLEAKGYERDPDRPFALRKRGEKTRPVLGEIARVKLGDADLVAVHLDSVGTRFYLVEADGSQSGLSDEAAGVLMAMAQIGPSK